MTLRFFSHNWWCQLTCRRSPMTGHLQIWGAKFRDKVLTFSSNRLIIRASRGTGHMKTLSRAGRFFLVGVELTLSPSSSNVTIFSRLLVAVLQPPLPLSSSRVWLATTVIPAVTGGVIAEDGLSTDAGGGGGTAMSVTAAARLNSLTLRGTKYSKCNELSCWQCCWWWCSGCCWCCCCCWWWCCVGDKQLLLNGWPRWNCCCWTLTPEDKTLLVIVLLATSSGNVFFRGSVWWPGDNFMAVLDGWARSLPSPGLLAWCCQEPAGTIDMAIASSSCSDSRESLVPPPSSRSALRPGAAPAAKKRRETVTRVSWWPIASIV